VTTLVSVAALGIGEPSFAASAETTASVLEMGENVFHQGSLGWEMGGAAMEVAREVRARTNRALGLHCATSSDNSVLLTMHGLVEEVRIGSRHLGDWRSDWDHVGILLRAVSTGTRAHVTILCRPRFEPVCADWAASAVGGDFVQVELNDKVSKCVEDVGATLLRAREEIFARGSIVYGHGTVIRFHILHLIASQSLSGNELGR
jgi:hypothetical protein